MKVARCKLQVNQRLRRSLHQALPAYANLCQALPAYPPRPLFKTEAGKSEDGNRRKGGRFKGTAVVDTPLQKTVAVTQSPVTAGRGF